MLEEYAKSQPEFYRTVVQTIREKQRISHAYFIETNGYQDVRSFAFSFVKFLVCPFHFVNREQCKDCSLCHMIENGTYDDLKIIEPDGQWIKKEQLMQLQEDFKTKSLENRLRIYLIFNADKLNKASANSILKFLEEPEDDIIAILFADNRYQVLDTIISRCQVYRLSNHETEQMSVTPEILDSVFTFVNFIEKKGLKTIAYLPEFWNPVVKTKESFLEFIDLLQKYYETLIEVSLGKELTYTCFSGKIDTIRAITTKHTIHDLISKLHIVYEIPEKLKFNANQSLLMDKLIIDLCGGVK